MAASSFIDRKPKPVEIPRFACPTCQDGGLVPTAPQTEAYADLFKNNVPCVCAGGDQWRTEFEVRENPPKCACGRKAVYCVLSERPVCKACFGDVLTDYRDAMAARLGKQAAPATWKGWSK